MAATGDEPEKLYDVQYLVTPVPEKATARVEMRLNQPRRLLREVSMSMPANRFTRLGGDGEIVRDGNRVRWLPPQTGGVLRWTVEVPNKRYGDSYDAWMGEDWALFRASDIIPPALTRTVVGAQSRTTIEFDLPGGWSSVTQYRERRGVYSVTHSDRRFDRPSGWILLGKLGVRIETIAGIRVLVAGPAGEGVRRMDMLALLHWTLPSLSKLLPDFPKRLTVVSAADSMWRGGLSGPRSLYIHSDLPLISENATSTLLHEVLHIGMGLRAKDNADWIVEGLAEYYALALLRRSRTISTERFAEAIKDLKAWGKESSQLCTSASTGATTARAVGVFAALNNEISNMTMQPNALDELLRSLVASGREVSTDDLRRVATEIAGSLPRSLQSKNLPGCD